MNTEENSKEFLYKMSTTLHKGLAKVAVLASKLYDLFDLLPVD